MPALISKYENLSFQEATRIIYFMFCREPKVFMQMMEELLDHPDEPKKYVAAGWYEQYRDHITSNKKA